MEPATGLTILGAAVGSAKVVEKILGPTAEYLGQGLKSWTEKAGANLGRIFQVASQRLGNQIDSPGSVPPRVLKGILDEGSFCEDEVGAEYFGGVLASARSGTSRDDRGAGFIALIGRLSTYQIRGHFLLYRLLKLLFDGSEHSVTTGEGRQALSIFIPSPAFAAGMEMTEKEEYSIVLSHTIVGLAGESLLGDRYHFGPAEYLRKNGVPDAPESGGIIVQPSTLGAELFLWAHGLGNVHTGRFLKREVQIRSNVGVAITPGIRSVKQDGPRLDDLLAPARPESPSDQKPLA